MTHKEASYTWKEMPYMTVDNEATYIGKKMLYTAADKTST